MKKLLVTGIILALSHFASAKNNESTVKNSIDTNAWHDFEGDLGKTKVRLSIYVPENANTLKGNYCYTKYDQRIKLNGKVVGSHIELDEISEGKVTGHFSGDITQDEFTHFTGIWTSPSGKKIDFSLNHESRIYTSANSRYLADKPDVEVESFMNAVKKAILNGDSDWVAKHTRFPIDVELKGKKRTITSEKKLKKHFDEIFHHSFKESIKSASTCNMFTKSGRVMLGYGQIWIEGDSITSIYN